MSDDLVQQTDQMKAAFLIAEVELASREGRFVDPQAMFKEWDSWLARIRAEAWDEGYFARTADYPDDPEERNNPYREEARG